MSNFPFTPAITPLCTARYAWIERVSGGMYGGKYEITLELRKDNPEHDAFMNAVYGAWQAWINQKVQEGVQIPADLSFSLFKPDVDKSGVATPGVYLFKMRSKYQPDVWDTADPPKKVEPKVYSGAEVMVSIKSNFSIPQQGCGLSFYPQGVQVHKQGEVKGSGANFGAVQGGYVGNAQAPAADAPSQGFSANNAQSNPTTQGGGNAAQQNPTFAPKSNQQPAQAAHGFGMQQARTEEVAAQVGQSQQQGKPAVDQNTAPVESPPWQDTKQVEAPVAAVVPTASFSPSAAAVTTTDEPVASVTAPVQTLEGQVQAGVDAASQSQASAHHTGFPHQHA